MDSTGIIIWDLEIFPHDFMLGALELHRDGSKNLFQLWSREEIRQFYFAHQDWIWVGHNSLEYDSPVLSTIIDEGDPYETSREIVKGGQRYMRGKYPRWNYDLMKAGNRMAYSLKLTELWDGKDIDETEVSFETPRPLTQEEIERTNRYNEADLEQTYDNYLRLKDTLDLRLKICTEFNLPLNTLTYTGTKLAATVLGAHQIDGIEYMHIKPKLYPELRLQNQELLEFYLNEDFRKGKKLNLMLCGAMHQIGQGGIHAALESYHAPRALYFDVSGYYNLVMILKDLLPRTLGKDGMEMYTRMYHEQLEMKKTKDPRRPVYKTILLSVFGAMGNKYTDFYDPEKLLLVTITGQLFIVDLLEKLEGKVRVIQSNTDGIIVEPYDWSQKDEIIGIVKDWCTRTGFVISPKEVTDIWQRDVNCYVYRENGEIHTVGGAVNAYGHEDNIFAKNGYEHNEPYIYDYAIVDFFLNGVSPEETVEKYKRNLRMFQYAVKKKSFDYTELQSNFKDGSVTIERLQGVNRAFASALTDRTATIYKCRKEGKVKRAKVASVPENAFVYDRSITEPETFGQLESLIDWDFYINRAQEKIDSFLRIPKIKKLTLSRHPAFEKLYL